VKTEVLSIAFIKKYIQYSKSKPAPVLTKGAANHIVNVYANLRNEDEGQTNRKKTAPLTARTLETLIRLSTAHAKARLSVKVESDDARAAEEIMRYALYKEVAKRQKKKKRKLNRAGAAGDKDEDDSQDSSDEDENDQGEDEQPEVPERMSMPPQAPANKQPASNQSSQDTLWNDSSQDLAMDTLPTATTGPSQEGGVPPERLQLFRARLANLFSTRLQDEEQVFLAELVEMVNEGLPTGALFGTAEATAACQVMSDADELMISEGIVYKV
jgi:DNA replication licensing factor MCM3